MLQFVLTFLIIKYIYRHVTIVASVKPFFWGVFFWVFRSIFRFFLRICLENFFGFFNQVEVRTIFFSKVSFFSEFSGVFFRVFMYFSEFYYFLGSLEYISVFEYFSGFLNQNLSPYFFLGPSSIFPRIYLSELWVIFHFFIFLPIVLFGISGVFFRIFEAKLDENLFFRSHRCFFGFFRMILGLFPFFSSKTLP